MTSGPVHETAVFLALQSFRDRLAGAQARRPGVFQFELTGAEPGSHALEVDEHRNVTLVAGTSERRPRSLVSGDGRKIRMVLEGSLDAGEAFLSGGIQFRGDVHHLEDLLRELRLSGARPRRRAGADAATEGV
jgi:hypothetical protein